MIMQLCNYVKFARYNLKNSHRRHIYSCWSI